MTGPVCALGGLVCGDPLGVYLAIMILVGLGVVMLFLVACLIAGIAERVKARRDRWPKAPPMPPGWAPPPPPRG